MRRLLTFLALFLALAPSSASAQVSIWLQKGVSGLGASASFSFNNQLTGYGVDAGYSYKGFLDFDINATYYGYPSDQEIFTDQHVYGVGPTIQYHPLKQDKDMPVSVSLGVGYQKIFFSSDTLSQEGGSIDAWNVGVNGSVYHFFRLGENTGVIPAVGLTFVHSETTISGPNGSLSGSSDDLGLSLAGYFAYIDDGGHIYGVAPGLIIGDHLTFGIQIGVVWSLL
jgi:hypothetical protein